MSEKKDFKIPAWMLETSDDAPETPAKPAKPVQRSKPQSQRKYKDKVKTYLNKVDKASGY